MKENVMACEPESNFFARPRYFEKASNFDGLELRKQPPQASHMCEVCKGYGRWNNRIDVYKGYQDSRHPHTTHICWDCNGSGWVWDTHTHDYVETVLGKNYFSYRCKICGYEKFIDSGD